MIRKKDLLKSFLAIVIVAAGCLSITAQRTPDKISSSGCGAASGLNGVYRIDVDSSDRLYSVIEGATSKVPYREQHQFFIDLAVRLTPPDLLAIECTGKRVLLASSRSPRVEFIADGASRNARAYDGRIVRSRIRFDRESLTFSSSGGGDDLNFTFTPLDGGSRLRVTRRISAQELIEPVVISTIYEKINEIARWDIFDNQKTDAVTAEKSSEQTDTKAEPVNVVKTTPQTANAEYKDVDLLRDMLGEWIEATNQRDIEKQMSFYMPVLKAFYLARNAPMKVVRDEKNRVFASAKLIEINAAEPEIIFQDAGRTAIMRFRKKYNVVNGGRSRSGEVVQELRWQKADGDWKIFSERDIRVIR